jgi:hypothetical protein
VRISSWWFGVGRSREDEFGIPTGDLSERDRQSTPTEEERNVRPSGE